MSQHEEGRPRSGNREAASRVSTAGASSLLSVPPMPAGVLGLDNADPLWVADGLRCLAELADTGRVFTVDDLRVAPYAVPDPAHPSAWGGLVRASAMAGTIRRVGFATSTRLSRHGSIVSLWRGTRRGVRS